MVFEQLSDTLFWISPKSSAFIMEALVLAGEHGKYTVVSELTFVYGGDFVSALSALLIAYIAGDGNFFQKRGFEMYEDKTLVCKECGNEFVFTAGEQEFYAERGFQNEPQRCKTCRDARITLPVVPASSSPQSVLHAAARQRFLLSPSLIVLYTAASALLR